MTDAEAVVTAFVREFDAPEVEAGQIAAYFTPDAVYHNIPMQPVVGAEAIGKALAAMAAQGLRSAGWEVKHQVARGDIVMNERVDRFTLGERRVEIPVMGVFEVREGKIAAWRDYFDLGMLRDQMA